MTRKYKIMATSPKGATPSISRYIFNGAYVPGDFEVNNIDDALTKLKEMRAHANPNWVYRIHVITVEVLDV